jgi:hypothetical protein|tara:strand:- start:327 stop:698 length:372 start_codon:yes stop_codon:yes gene_type:complete
MKYLIYRVRKLYQKGDLESSESVRSMMMGYLNLFIAFVVVSFWIIFPHIVVEHYSTWYFLPLVFGLAILLSFLILLVFDRNINEEKFSNSKLNIIIKDWMLSALPLFILGITILLKVVFSVVL